MDNQQRTPEECIFNTSDGQALFYRHWPALNTNSSARKVIVLFHRGHEHSGRLQHIVDELGMADADFYAWDARGHGKTQGDRGYSPSLGRSVRDVEEFMRHVVQHSGVAMHDIIVVGQSVGAVLVATWVHDYAPPIRGMVLASPAFKVKLYVPFARSGLRLMQRLRGLFYVNSYVKGKFLTHCPARVASFDSDPLVTRPIAVNILLELYKTAERVVSDAAAITTPTQLLISGDDYVVHRRPQLDFYQKLRSSVKELHILPGFYHDTLGELNREMAFSRMREFIGTLYATAPQQFDYAQESRWSPSADVWRSLQAPPARYSAEGLWYAGLRAGMKTLGVQSEGVRLGMKTGFDSGSTLDYVYRNTPQGKTGLGRMIDKGYLESVGWKGIRQRKVHLETLIREAIARLGAEGKPVRIVDVAAGHGRYVLDALAQEQGVESILLRDYSELNVQKGQALIAERSMIHSARFERGDAFNTAELAALSPQPTLGIVSGLYELFPDNAQVRASLTGLAQAIEPGGILLYTGQPWHPQLKTIAWSLTSHRDNQPWIMRVRSQGEMDALVHEAGFDKCEQLIDEWGIFTVSMAVRRA